MRRSSWYSLMIVAAVGWVIAGLMAFSLVSRVGWFGILIIGLIIILVPQLAELDADSPAWSETLLRRLRWTPKMRQLAKVEPCP